MTAEGAKDATMRWMPTARSLFIPFANFRPFVAIFFFEDGITDGMNLIA